MNTVKGYKMKKSLSIKALFISTLALGIMALIGYNMHDRIMGVPLVIETASNGSTIESPFLSISGTALHARELLLNGRPIAVDRKGAFKDEILLSPGYNMVEISARDQFGKEKIKTYQFIVTIPEAVAVTNTKETKNN